MPSTGSASTTTTEPAPPSGRGPACPRAPGPGARWAPWPGYPRLPEWAPAARTSLVVLAAVVLTGLAAALARWGRAQNDLLSRPPSSNLNSSRAEAAEPRVPPPRLEPERPTVGANEPAIPVALAAAQVPELTLPEPAPRPPYRPPPAPADVAPVSLVEPAAPAGEPPPEPAFLDELLTIRNLHRGDDPMTRYWTRLGLPAFLAVALAAPPLPSAEGPEPASRGSSDRTAKDLKEVLDQIKALQTSLDQMKASFHDNAEDLRALKKSLQDSFDQVGKDIQQIRTEQTSATASAARLRQDLDALRTEVANVRRDLDDLRNRAAGGPTSSTSGYAGAAGTARVRLRNDYYEPVRVVVNGRSYDLQPGETRTVEQIPAGTFTYEVLNITPARTRTVAANEVFTVQVYPRF